MDLPERDVAREVEEFRSVSHQRDLLVAKVGDSTAMVQGSSDFQIHASPIFSLVVAAMPPVQSRFAAASLVAGLAASAFVAPSTRGDRQLRAGGASKVPARTPVAQQKTGDGLAALAILGAGLAAVRGSRTQVNAAAAVEAPEPPLFQPSEQFGATELVGFFDPLGFTKVGDEKGFRKLRVSEIKHGRVAMMASIGLVAQHFVKFPFFENAPAGFSIMDKGEGVLGFFGIFLACAPLELWWRENPEREPGNYGDPFGVNMYTEEMRMKELNNGRMAMISVLGIFAAEMATGKDAMQQFGLPAIGGARASASSSSSFAGRTSSRLVAHQRVVRRAEAVIQEDAPPLFQPSEQFGATEPVGFFDPLGFTKVGDEKGFRKLRVSEIKHGRVAMMASIGLVAQHFVKFPFFENAPAGFSIMDKGEGVLGFFGIFLACAPLELWWRENPEREPGNYGDPFGVNMYTEEMRMKELNNGRMAMISVLGIFAAEMATGKDAMQQFGLPAIGGARASASSSSSFAGCTSSRLAHQRVVRRAEAVIQEDAPPLFQPSEQFGATEPVGFFDPLGFTKVGDEKGFRKLRVSEIKHGRVAMMASIGLVAQHFVKFPFFENAPAGFSIMDKGEGVLGFFGIFLACAPLELWWRENPEREPGNYGDPFGVNMYTEEMRMKELNNGRMAMISVLGIFAAEMATGKDAMQQFGLPAIGGARASASSSSSFAGRTSSRLVAHQRVVRRAEAVIQEDAPPLFQPSEQFGATEPVGFFDPLGFTKVGDEKGFRKLRVSEIKHGRVAMMASIGLVAQHFVKFPFFENAPAGFSIMDKGEGVLGFFGIFLACAPLELWWRENPEREPGNYGDPFGVNMYTEEMRMKELNNGRMAMISVLGIFAAEMATGKDAMQQFGL